MLQIGCGEYGATKRMWEIWCHKRDVRDMVPQNECAGYGATKGVRDMVSQNIFGGYSATQGCGGYGVTKGRCGIWYHKKVHFQPK